MKLTLLSLFIATNVFARPEIIGGQQATSTEAPWVVKINRSGEDHCSGSLIGQRWVLTAAHCFDRGDWTEQFSVLGGGTGQKKDLVDLGPMKQIFVHPDYFITSITPQQDIALIELERDVVLSKTLSPIPIATKKEFEKIRDKYPVSVFGWGKINLNNDSPLSLMRMDATLIKTKDIPTLSSMTFFQQNPRWASTDFAVVVSEETATCYGDSGTGWIMNPKNGPILVAVHSAGDRCNSISVGNVVSTHIDWIYETMEQLSKPSLK